MKSEHTPGPWRAGLFDGHEAIIADVDGGPYVVALMDSGNGTAPEAEVLANRDLFLAAPDLLAACKALVLVADDTLPIQDGRRVDGHYYREKLNRIFNTADAARMALARAEGKE